MCITGRWINRCRIFAYKGRANFVITILNQVTSLFNEIMQLWSINLFEVSCMYATAGWFLNIIPYLKKQKYVDFKRDVLTISYKQPYIVFEIGLQLHYFLFVRIIFAMFCFRLRINIENQKKKSNFFFHEEESEIMRVGKKSKQHIIS